MTWANPVSGNWNTAANWSPAAVPTSADDVSITLAGTYTVTVDANATVNSLTVSGTQTLSIPSAKTLTLNSASAFGVGTTLSIPSGGTLNNNATLSLSGTTTLTGTIKGGTLISTTTLASSSGTLDAVTLGGTTFTHSGTLNILNGITLANGLTVNKGNTNWYFKTAGLQHIAIEGGAGSATINTAGGSITAGGSAAGQNLQIDSGVTIQGYSNLRQAYSPSDIINAGTIIANTSGQTFNITPGTFTSTGTLNVSGGILTINPTTAWSNAAGNTTVSSGTLNLYSAFTLAGLGTYTRSGGTVNIYGTLDLQNSATPFDISSAGQLGTGGLSTLYGTILNGTIIGTPLNVSSGTLDNVTIGSSMSGSGANLYITSNLTLANGINFNTGGYTILFNGAAANINLAAGATSATLTKAGGSLRANSGNNSGIVTIASGVTIQGYGSITENFTGGWVNNGTFNSNVAGQTLTIISTNFTNNGTVTASLGTVGLTPTNLTLSAGNVLNVSGGTLTINPGTNWNDAAGNLTVSAGTLNLYKTFTFAGLGTYTRSGGTVNIYGTLDLQNSATPFDISSAGQLGTGGLSTLYGTILNGTIIGTPLNVSSGTLNNVTIGSSMTVGGLYLFISNNLTLANGINLTSSGYFYFNGAAANINLAAGATSATLTKAGGGLRANNGNNSGIATIASGVTIQGYGSIYESYTGGGWVNNGTFNSNVAGQTLTIISTNFTNNGTVSVTAGTITISSTTFTQSGTIDVASGATFNRTVGFTNSGIVSGSGTINLGSSALTNNGSINPGTAGTAGTLTVTGTDPMSSSSILNVDLGGTTVGTGYDRLAVSSTATLNGTLNVNLINSFMPSGGDTFKVMTYSSNSGSFSMYSMPTLSSGRYWCFGSA